MTEPERTGAPVELGVDLRLEHGERLTIIRAASRADKWARARDEGAFGSSRDGTGFGPERAELLDELLYVAASRTRAVVGLAYGGRKGSWGPLHVAVLSTDLDAVLAALTALFETGDEAPLREFLRRPPALAYGAAWEPPTPGEGFAGR